MEELLNNIIDKIKEMNSKRKLIENNKKELYRLKANKEKFRNKDNSLNPQLKGVYDNVTKQMAELLRQNRSLNKEVRKIKTPIVEKFTSDIETKKEKIENNKIELHRLRSNKEKLRNKDNSIKPELKKVQDDITINMRNLLKENRRLSADVKKLESIIVDFKENNYDKYLKNENTIKVEEKSAERTLSTDNEETSKKEIDEYYKKQEEDSKKKIEADNKKMDRANKKKRRDDEKLEKFYNEQAKKEIEEYEKELDKEEEEEFKRAIESSVKEQDKISEQEQKVIDDFYKQLEYAKQQREKNEYEFGYNSKETTEYWQEKDLEEQAKKEIEEYEKELDKEEEQELKRAVESVKKAREEAKEQESNQIDVEETKEPEYTENTDNLYNFNNATLKDLEGEYQVDADILNSRHKENDDKIIDKISMAIEDNSVIINKHDAKEMLKKAPKKIKQEFLKFINNGVRFDGNIALGLLDNENQLFKYLEICEKYDDLSLIGPQNAKARAELAEFLPQVEYLLKGLRKSDIEWPRKIKIYQTAKLTQRIYKEFGRGKDVKIKMNLFDKIYFGIASIMGNTNNHLPSGESSREEQYTTENNHNGLAEKIANSITEQEKKDKFAERMAQQMVKNEEEEVNARREKLAKRMADIIEETDYNDKQNKDTDNVK